MYSENHMQSLRKKYNKTLWTYIGVSVLSMAVSFFLVYRYLSADDSLIPWLIAAGAGLALATIECAIERALYKRGKNADILLLGFVLGTAIVFLALTNTILLDGYTHLFLPVILGFLFNRPLIPAIGLMRDYSRLNEGNPSETVGRMKSGTRRWEAIVGKSSYLLFEDELTGEVHLLLTGSMDPARRYRVLYLPHSGLAVGEAIPDNVTFDPFGNPVEREVEEADETEIPAYTADTYAENPSYAKEAPDTADTEPAYSAASPTAEELNPNSPARQKAAKFALASKVCKGLAYVGFGLTFIGGIILDDTPGAVLVFPAVLLVFGGFLLGDYFKKQDRKLRCTRRTTARCIDTVRRKSGKHSHLYPVVGFEVDGVSYTAELSVTCSHSSVGELYPIYYDPLDPESVRVA